MSAKRAVDPSPLWIFGYGSLVWRPEFPHRERTPAYVRGWTRRFWQGSTDHRGLPGAPGRVVTLVPRPSDDAICWGMAYRVEPGAEGAVLAGLDRREQGGYQRFEVELSFADRERSGGTVGLMYVAGSQNDNYLGSADVESIARQVSGSHGPSGSNVEYVLRLAEALREMGAGDQHVFAVEAALRDQIG